MKFDSESLWRHASNVACYLIKAYQCLKAKEHSNEILQSYIKQMNEINEECTKMTFIQICAFASGYLEEPKTSLKDAVKFSTSLPVKGENKDDNMIFSYFMILVAFHLASYKKEWKQPMEEM